MSDYSRFQDEYASVFPLYERLARKLEGLLRQHLTSGGQRLAEVSARPKDPSSFIKKALRKGYSDPMREIGDKAGVRIVVPFARDRERVEYLCSEILHLEARDDKGEALGLERVGYLGLHFKATLRPGIVGSADSDLEGLAAELQVHTKIQSAWAAAAHDSLYKTEIPVPDQVGRRITRLGALAEIFDDEVERFLTEVSALPGFADLDALVGPLDALLLRYTSQAGDKGLSALLIPALRSLYAESADQIVPQHIVPFVNGQHEELCAFYAEHHGDSRANPLIYQPEGLMLLERLQNNPYLIKSAWPGAIDIGLLERLADRRGARLH